MKLTVVKFFPLVSCLQESAHLPQKASLRLCRCRITHNKLNCSMCHAHFLMLAARGRVTLHSINIFLLASLLWLKFNLFSTTTTTICGIMVPISVSFCIKKDKPPYSIILASRSAACSWGSSSFRKISSFDQRLPLMENLSYSLNDAFQ